MNGGEDPPTLRQVVLDKREYWSRLGLIASIAFFLGFVLGAACGPARASAASEPLTYWTVETLGARMDATAVAEGCGCAAWLRQIAERESRWADSDYNAMRAVTIVNPESGAYGPMQFVPGGVWQACPVATEKSPYEATLDEQLDCAAWAYAHGYAGHW